MEKILKSVEKFKKPAKKLHTEAQTLPEQCKKDKISTTRYNHYVKAVNKRYASIECAFINKKHGLTVLGSSIPQVN
jgi:hypothetical protein